MDRIKKLLIAIDEGPISEKIASAGFQLSQQLNAEVALLSVIDTASLISDGVNPKELAEDYKKDFKKVQQIIIDKVFKKNKVFTFIEVGTPSVAILKVAEEWEADLIVLGTHGRTGLAHLIMGSVAEHIIRHSTKPLFIVPAK